MPSFGSKESPSLKKMDYNNNNNNARYGGGSKFSMGHIVGDPFSLATIGIALVSRQEHGAQYEEALIVR